MSNLGLWGKNPCFITLLFCHLVLPNLVNLFNASELVVEEIWLSGWVVIAFGSGVAGLSVLFPHPHSTHDPWLPLPVLFSSRACSLCPWCVLSTACSLTHHDFGSVGSSRTGFGAFLVSRGFSSSPPRVAEAPTHCNSRPCCCFVHPREKSELFSLTQRSVHPHAEKSGMYFPCILLLGVSSSTRTGCLGRFPM